MQFPIGGEGKAKVENYLAPLDCIDSQCNLLLVGLA